LHREISLIAARTTPRPKRHPPNYATAQKFGRRAENISTHFGPSKSTAEWPPGFHYLSDSKGKRRSTGMVKRPRSDVAAEP
jgi:hypothetical protein